MAHGYVSDIDGDDTMMDSPHATVSIDLTQLPPEQAISIAREAGFDQQHDYALGQLAQGSEDPDDIEDAVFHLPIGAAVAALGSVGVIDLGEENE